MYRRNLTSKKVVLLLTACCVLLTPKDVYAKLGSPLSKEEIITGSEFIAIVQIAHVDLVVVKGAGDTYSQAASAIVERKIKGELPEHITLYGGEDFTCAQVNFSPGRYLVFLRRDNELLRGTEWQSSVRPIIRDVVEWYPDGNNFKDKPASLSFVIRDIENILGYSLEPKASQTVHTGGGGNYLLIILVGFFIISSLTYSTLRSALIIGAVAYFVRQIGGIFKR